MARQILPVFVTGSDVDDLKRRLRAAAMGADQSVQGCASIGDNQRAAWGDFYTSVLAYVNEPTSFWSAAAEMNRGQAYEDELVSWNSQLQGAGCQLVTPQYDPSKDAARDATVNVLKWVAVGAVAVSGAYIVGKVAEVAELLPKLPAVRKNEPRRPAARRPRR
jgi:hypothetical protein